MFGFEIPKNYAHAMVLDKRNGNTRWKDCTQLELDQLYDYSTFKDMVKFLKLLMGIRRYVLILYMLSNMMVDIRYAW